MLRDDFSDLEMQRLNKLEQLRTMGQEPYPLRSYKSHTNAGAVALFEKAEADGSEETVEVVLAGRLRAIRNMGMLSFAHIEDRTGKIQLLMRVNEIGQEKLDEFVRFYDLGDFIEASGQMMRTRRGEVTLQVQEFRMLSKALLPLPADKDETVDGEVVRHAQLTDPETRYRKRYVDLAVNPEVREIFESGLRRSRRSVLFWTNVTLSKLKRQFCSRSTAARRLVLSRPITISCIRNCFCASALSSI